VNLELADLTDAVQICELLNLAYRGTEGWTTENALVAGDRCRESDIVADIQSSDRHFLVYKADNLIQACIAIQKMGARAYIGSFAVNPKAQNAGIGKSVLYCAEQFAVNRLQSTEFVMVVLSSRVELIEFYERRGYRRNGNIKEYPKHLNIGIPLICDLTVEELTKNA
jgi:ribosomal protein S18 acetylase RimI-like enzyme